MWRDYFTNANIIGLDILPPAQQILKLQGQNKIGDVQGDQSDEASLAKGVRLAGDAGFDVIIDHAAHVGLADIVDSSATVTRFPNHDYGMIGFVKQLVDELHGADIRAEKQRRYRIPHVHPACRDDR